MSVENALRMREPYFVEAQLKKNPVFCIDDRPSEAPIYIKISGGGASLAITNKLMHNLNGQELDSNFAQDAETVILAANSEGYMVGLHNVNPPIDCGFLAKARDIATYTTTDRQPILKIVSDSGLLTDHDASNTVPSIFDAYQELAIDDGFFSVSPLTVARYSLRAGALTMDVVGKHNPQSIGIINEVVNSTLDTTAAAKADLPAYNYDSWAFKELVGNIHSFKDFDSNVSELTALIGTIATFKVLGVKDIYVRR